MTNVTRFHNNAKQKPQKVIAKEAKVKQGALAKCIYISLFELALNTFCIVNILIKQKMFF